jgi:NitT/TauT family transport system substrate-binding protein
MRPLFPALALAFAAVLAGASFASANETVRLGVQATGTVKWELSAMQALGLDAQNGVTLDIREVADAKAGQLALQAGAVDIILSDFVFVSVARSKGSDLTLVPHSLAVGGLLVDPAAGITALADLKGKRLAVSGSPVDKSFVILSAAYRKATGTNLADDATLRFGAPPLVNELFEKGEADAALNLWNWNARAIAAGKTELVSVPALLRSLGIADTPPLLGWSFSETWAKAHPLAIKGFLDASFATKERLQRDNALWDSLKPLMQVADQPDLFPLLRDAYRAGIVSAYDPAATGPAEDLFSILVATGGLDLGGGLTSLYPGTFWAGYRR